jgi:glycosyltransferase involved in cell wall biosynthesis
VIPKISVITPSYNQASYLRETIDQVLAQNYPNLDYLIIDGGSTDGTLDILQTYTNRLTWLGEPDHGQAEAINKGLQRATGDILAWLNSDDLYLPGALQCIADFFTRQPDVDMVYGDYHLIDSRGKLLLRKKEIPFDYNILLYGLDYISQPTTFFRRRVVERVGYLDESLHYGLDWEYWLRIARAGGQVAHIPRYLAAARWHPQAKTIIAPAQMYAEHQAIRQRYGDRPRFRSARLQRLYAAWLNKRYRLKRQLLKIVLRQTIDFPPGNWVMARQRL